MRQARSMAVVFKLRGPRGRVQVMWGARDKLGRLVHGPKKGSPGVFGDWDVWLDLGS